MGCDIHMYPEQKGRVNGRDHWTFRYRFGAHADSFWSRTYPPRDRANYYAWDDRWYWLFGQLAGVRRDGPPIVEPRGIPEDADPEIKEELEDSDFHTHSWLTLAELQTHDWDKAWAATGEPAHEINAVKLWLRRLAEIDPDPKNVRIVFAFDN